MNKRFIKTPLKGIEIHGVKDVGTRTVNLLMGEHAGEYVRGDIMDANAVIQAFDELKGNVDGTHDTLEELVDEIHTNATVINGAINYTNKVEAESKARDEKETKDRTDADNTLGRRIDGEVTARKEADEAELSRATQEEARLDSDIKNEASIRKSEDDKLASTIDGEVRRAQSAEQDITNALHAEIGTRTQQDAEIKDLLQNETVRATNSEAILQDNIDTESSARKNSDDVITTNLNSEITRAKAAEKANKDRIDIIDGDSNTDGSYRKAIKDLIGGAPEAYDTLKEIADKLAEDDDLHQVIEEAIATKASKTELNEESDRAKTAEANNASAIDNEKNRALQAEADITTNLNKEIDRAKKAEQDNAAAIANEVTRATAKETELSNSIIAESNTARSAEKVNSDKIDAEIARAKGVESDNAQAIAAEETRATDAETALNTSIETEVQRAKDKEAYLQQLIDTKADTTALDSVKDELTNKITDEFERAGNAEDELSDRIDAEVARATAAETSIVDDLNAKFDTKVDSTTLTALEAKVSANTEAITNISTSKGIPYDASVTDSYQTDKSLKIKISDTTTAHISPHDGIYTTNGNNSHVQINPTYISTLSDNFSFNVNPGGIIQTASNYNLNINSNGFILTSGNTNENSGFKITPSEFSVEQGGQKWLDIHNANINIGITDTSSVLINPTTIQLTQDESKIKLSPTELLIQNEGEQLVRYTNYALTLNRESNDSITIGWYIGNYGIFIPGDISTAMLRCDSLKFNSFGFSYNGIYRNMDTTSWTTVYDLSNNTFYGNFEDNLGNLRLGILSKQDKITPTTELDLTSIDTADIESLRSIVKSLATELNTLGLIKLKSAS